MSEKVKSKAHPFADHLRRSEKVLWVMPQENISIRIYAKGALLRLALLLLVPLLYALTVALRVRYEDYYYVILGIMIVLSAFAVIGEAARDRLFPHIYALTNERLLSRHRQQVTTYPLEDIQSISIVKDEQQRDSLSFSPYFLIWSGVNNADQVKHMIEEARAMCLQDHEE